MQNLFMNNACLTVDNGIQNMGSVSQNFKHRFHLFLVSIVVDKLTER